MPERLLVGAAVTAATAVLFAYAGALTWRREVPSRARTANRAFSLWWWSAAAVISLLSVANVLGILGIRGDDVHATLHYLRAAPLSLALGGLMYYLLFLFTGRRDLLLPVAAAYLAQHAFTIYYYVRLGPMRTVVTGWDVRVVPAAPADPALSAAFGLTLALPVVLACGAYVAIALRHGDRQQRYRVALIGVALGQWFLLLLVSFLLGLQQREWFSMLYQVPGLLSAALVVVALRPPAWLRARMGLEAAAQPSRSAGGTGSR